MFDTPPVGRSRVAASLVVLLPLLVVLLLVFVTACKKAEEGGESSSSVGESRMEQRLNLELQLKELQTQIEGLENTSAENRFVLMEAAMQQIRLLRAEINDLDGWAIADEGPDGADGGDADTADGADAADEDSRSEVDKAVKKLEQANYALEAPAKARLGERLEAEFTISMSEEPRVLLEGLAAAEGAQVESGSVAVGAEVIVRLKSSKGLEVAELVGPARRPLPSTGNQTWVWEVVAREAGGQQLVFTVSVPLKLADSQDEYVVQTFRRELSVEVSPRKIVWDFVKKEWKWLWTAIFIPIGVWVWRRLKGPKKPE